MKEMKTLTLPNGVTYEIVDDKARNDISKIGSTNKRDSAPPVTKIIAGPSIVVDDSAERPLNGLKLFGKTSQVNTTGTNLLQNTDDSTEANGVKFTVYDDGSVHAKGTATANTYLTVSGGFYNAAAVIPDWLAVGQTYTITDATLYLYKTDGTFASYTNNTVTIPNGYTYYGIFVVITSGATVDKMYYPRVNAGSVALPWEPFTGNVASPSPDYPQELISVENPTVTIRGGNLLPTTYADGTSKTMNGITFEALSDGSVIVNGTATENAYFTFKYASNKMALPNGWLSTYCGTGYGTGRVQIQNDIYVDGVYVHSLQTINETSSRKQFFGKVELGSTRLKVDAGTTVVSQRVYPMLCAFENPIDYEQPKQSQNLVIARNIPGIPVTSNGNYTDSNGQQWICDEIDFERGVYIQRVGIATMDTCSVIEYMVLDSNGRAQLIAAPQLSKNQHIYGTMCNVASINPAPLEAVSGEYYENPANIVFVGDVGESESSIKEKYANFEYCYIIAIPIETALTEEELAAFEPLYSHSTNTTVLNDSGARMEMKYSADLASWARQYVTDVSGEVNAEKIEAAVESYLNENPVSSNTSATVVNGVLVIK